MHGGVLGGGAGGLHAVPRQVVVRGQRRVQREARAHAAQPGLVVSANIKMGFIPDQTHLPIVIVYSILGREAFIYLQ